MKKVSKIFFFVLFLALVGCSQNAHLRHKEAQAERDLVDLQSALLHGQADSVWLISQRAKDIHYFIFRAGKVIFWSDNSLTTPQIFVHKYDAWYDDQFTNVLCRCMWKRVDDYQIQAVIPLDWKLSETSRKEIEQSFSYKPLLDADDTGGPFHLSAHARVRLYSILTILAFLGVLIWGIIMMVRARGFRNLRLSYKIQFTTLIVLLIGYVSVFVVSGRYIRRHSQQRQEAELRQKCRFIQTALQNLYFWDFSLNAVSADNLSADLRDLAYAYGTDIHVYGLDGRLIGSSTPSLFQHRLLSVLLSPEVMFSGGPTTTTCYSSVGDMRYLSAYTDFVNGSFLSLGYIAVPSFISEEETAQELDDFLARLFPLFIIALVAAFIFSIGLSRALAAPIKAVAAQMANVSLRDPNAHIPYANTDEIGLLVAEYNKMLDALAQSSRRLAQSERESAWRTMARQIAHEINNPLTPMKLSVQQLQRLKGSPKFDAQFDKASAMLVEQIDNLSRIATSFSTFAKQPEVQVDEVDVAQKLAAAVALTTNNPQHIPIRYFGPEEGIIVQADKEQISQVFVNIIRNAVQAIGDKPKGDIMVILKDDPSSKEVEITISDNGPGIPLDIQSKMFTPYFTTKTNGTGLGLVISKNIVEGSNGRITFQTSKKGTSFFIYLRKVNGTILQPN